MTDIKTIPWYGYSTTVRAKRQAQKLSAIYYKAGAERAPDYTRRGQRVAMCGNTISVQNKHIMTQWHCADRMCPICQISEARRIASNARTVLDIACAESDIVPYMLTLTQKNCNGNELKSRIEDMLKAWKNINNGLKQNRKYIIGYARTLEVTTNKSDDYHPHLHIILLLAKTAPQEMLRARYWATAWQMYMQTQVYQGAIMPICDIRRIRPNKRRGLTSDAAAAAEVSKYCAKAGKIINSKDNYEKIITIAEAIAGKRLRAYGGVWREIRARLKLEDSMKACEPEAQYIANAPVEIWEWAGAEYRRTI